MPHRGQAHARRRSMVFFRPDDGTDNCVSADFDDTTYDDVVPHRLRGTLVISEEGEPTELVDLRADRRLA